MDESQKERSDNSETDDRNPEAAHHVDAIRAVPDYADADVSGDMLVALFQISDWGMDLYSGIFLWPGRFRHGGLQIVSVSHETTS